MCLDTWLIQHRLRMACEEEPCWPDCKKLGRWRVLRRVALLLLLPPLLRSPVRAACLRGAVSLVSRRI